MDTDQVNRPQRLSGAGTRNQQKAPRGFLFVYYDLHIVVNTCMSWFKRIPHRYPPVAPVAAPYKTSPATDHAQEKAKETGPKSNTKSSKKTRQ